MGAPARDIRRYDVLNATSACFALEMLRAEHVDLVLAAETMPENPGSELLSIVSRRFPQHVVSESKPA